MATIGGLPQRPSHMQTSLPITIPVMDSSVRPSSALARGIRITEYSDGRVNPDPIIVEESDVLLEEFLSPRKLRDLTGVEDLEDVHTLEMKVDTRDTSLGNFGTHLPNLSQLKLSNSIIQSVRDLGSGLDRVRVLWMSRCGLEDLDSVSSLNNLKELYLSYNEISDVSPCSMLENLQILDLEGNNINHFSQVEFLAMCRSLANLTLEGNPICVTPSPDQAEPKYDYRLAVQKAIPHLRVLDDESIAAGPVPPTKKSGVSAFEDDWRLIDELLKDATINISDDEADSSVRPPSSAGPRPSTGYRPGSALRPYTAALRPSSTRQRPGSALKQRPGSSGRPGSSESGGSRQGSRPESTDVDDLYDSSHLTVGAVVCGNPSKALKARLRPQIQSSNSEINKKLQEIRKQPQDVINAQIEPDENFKEVLGEVKEWKIGHQKILEDIEASKAAQVFVVSHTDEGLSEDEGSSSDESDHGTTFGPGRGQPPPSRITRFAPDNYTQGMRSKSRLGSATSQRSYHHHDECHDARDDGYFSRRTPEEELELKSPSRSSFTAPTPPKHLRSPSPGLKKPDVRRRLPSPGPLSQRPDILPDRPVIRSSYEQFSSSSTVRTTPPDRTPPGQSVPRIRKGHLAKVQLLPSKPFPK
ncbi:hypothetical protein CAPTEDRAFT_220260 [Capitella teleta]|uniref:U2A'/phosphoprotein 32 family A C-terminal domain-containing protein n=1 Tax=Capitella teleta TaxID=283909 RepID=R7TC50_CAPTE|nr:hypothetical protein CAPTEDRAFT_220260 [Capitella teleta]|eukprot:ELT91288.1 hypothetical protein CAPTEDRAFT_220260 [Capitella teleta]